MEPTRRTVPDHHEGREPAPASRSRLSGSRFGVLWSTRAKIAGVVLAVGGGVLGVVGPGPAEAAGSTAFTTPGISTYTVPAGITALTIDAFGASGGTGGKPACSQFCLNNGPGGRGGEAQAVIGVSPGETLEIVVGGQGGNGTAANFGGGVAGSGGFNGGAAGGGGNNAAGGGGGASDVRVGACAATMTCGLADRMVVAGGGAGGGGSGGCGLTAVGGAGGGASGGRGRSGCFVSTISDGGFGGSGGIGGAGGAVLADCCGNGGTAGDLGSGGAGGAGASGGGNGGGGGGGGYGGGGGGAGQRSDPGEGGGGGGGLGPSGVTFNSGVRLGDGGVTVTFGDSTPPVVTVAFSPNGQSSWFDTLPATGTVTGDDSTTGGSTVAGFHCTGATVHTVVETTTTTATATITVSAEGVTAVSCTATDGAGNTGASPGSRATATVQVDTTAPVLSLNPASDSCSVPGNSGWCRGTQTAGFSVSDALSGTTGPCTAAGGSSCDFTESTTTNGSSVPVPSGQVCDVAGNCTSSINAGPYEVDSVAPSASIDSVTAPSDGYLTGSSFSVPATVGSQPVSAGGTASDTTSAVASVTVNGLPTTGSWSAAGIALTPGSNQVSATVTDIAGNSATVSTSVALNLDLDGDGIQNNVDQAPAVPSTGFSDSQICSGAPAVCGSTTGTIQTPLPTGTTGVQVTDAASPSGVTVTTFGSSNQKVKLAIAGKGASYQVSVPGSMTITDPATTTTVDVLSGTGLVEENLDGTVLDIGIPAGGDATINETTGSGGTVTDVGLAGVSGGVTVNGQAVTPGSTLSLGLFQAGLTVTRGSFNFSGTFTPSPSSDGLRPLAEDVTLKLGPYLFTVPAGSFSVASDGSYAYSGSLQGVKLSIQLRQAKGGIWSVKGNGKSVRLTNPVGVGLTIGNDAGFCQVTASIT